MTVFYFQHEGKTHIVCTSDAYPSKNSPIWNSNTSVWLVPGTRIEPEIHIGFDPPK